MYVFWYMHAWRFIPHSGQEAWSFPKSFFKTVTNQFLRGLHYIAKHPKSTPEQCSKPCVILFRDSTTVPNWWFGTSMLFFRTKIGDF